MIFISSACVKHYKIKDSVQELVNNGFKNIELSGGTTFYNGFVEDLLELKAKYNLNYICHIIFDYMTNIIKDNMTNIITRIIFDYIYTGCSSIL